ncbi:MAG TPA: hypothetical protein VK207_07865 [Bacteroidales bacterium]|nr:hypothetical protein [Bacteroidales bacterium]
MDQIKNHPLYRKHDLDSLMSSMWDFYKKNFVALFVISLVVAIISQIASSMVDLREIQTMTDPALMLEKMREFIVPGIIIVLISLYFNTVLQHYIIYRPIDEGNNILKSLISAFKYYFPFIVIMILFAFAGAIGMVLGILALVIGAFFVALYLLTLYLFILPIMMVEGPDIGNTIARTFSLAHRKFWNNIGQVAVFLIIMIVISIVLSSLIMIPFAGSFLKNIFNPGDAAATDIYKNPVFIILSSLAGALTMPLLPILACMLYFNARAEEDDSAALITRPEEYRPTIDDLYSRPKDDERRNDGQPVS